MSSNQKDSESSQAKETEKSGSEAESKAEKPNQAPPLKTTSQERFDGSEYIDPDERVDL